MLIQKTITATPVWNKKGKNKKKKKQKKTSQPIINSCVNKKNWTGCKSVVVLEISNNGDSIQ